MRATDPRFDLMAETDLLRWLATAAHIIEGPYSVGAKMAARNRIEKASAELKRRNGATA